MTFNFEKSYDVTLCTLYILKLRRLCILFLAPCDDKKSTVVTINSSSVKQHRKDSGTFMQNVTSMFKNIRWLSVRSPLQAVTVQTAKTNHHHQQQPRLATFKKLSNGRNIFCVLKRQNTSQRLLPPDSSILPELIWLRFYTRLTTDTRSFTVVKK